jgi:hypothetical protein
MINTKIKLNMKTSKTQTNYRNNKVMVCLCLSLILFISGALKAATSNVSSVPALQTAINNATSGDVIILANGTYLNNTLNIGKNNITVKSATPGGVFLNGTNDININGNLITFSGFQFTSGDIGLNTVIEVNGNNNVLTQLNFSGYYAQKYIRIKDGSQYNQITYCNMEKKPAAAASGCTIQISTSPTVIGYHKIRYCSFKDYYGLGGDFGNEPIRIGLSTENSNKSRAIVEYCYFNNTGLGDSESVSIKCQENTIRFCTFTNQQNAMLVFRNGDNNVAYSNFFINAGGIRVKEANNIFCYNNYFENSGVGSSADAVTYIYDTTTYPVVLNNINFIHNTFYNCGTIDMGGNGATNNTWANNIFFKSSGSIFSNANSGTTWLGNIRQGILGISIPSGMTNANPLLVTNVDGYKGLSNGSPAIDVANSSYPSILDIAVIDDDPSLLFDGGGKSRPATVTLKDVGSDEFTTGATTNHPLAASEVGPSYLGGPSLSVITNEKVDAQNAIAIYPNPAKNAITIETSKESVGLVEVAIYNLNGQLIKSDVDFQKQVNTSRNNQYDVSDLNNGIYIVKVVSENASKTMKLILLR